jgi:hypothetical protein
VETKASPIKHGERVGRIQLNGTVALLATYGYCTTKVWEVSTGKCKVSVTNIESKTRPLAILFATDNSTLMVAQMTGRSDHSNLNESQPVWQVVAELEQAELERQFMNSASHMALSKDSSMVAVAY